MYSFQDVDFATEILLDEVFAFDEGLEQEFELDDEMPEDAGMEGYLFGWDSQPTTPRGRPPVLKNPFTKQPKCHRNCQTSMLG